MIISTGRRYVFVHIPKTGGTALTLALEERAMKDDILIGDTPKAMKRRRRVKQLRDQARGKLGKHATLADIDGVLPAGVLEGLFAFTLIRNPWDRMVSYFHWLQAQSFDHPAVHLARAVPFARFATDASTLRSFGGWSYGRYMQRADGVEQCSAFIRLEAVQDDIDPLVQHLGFRPNLAVVNRSSRDRDYRAYYTDTVAEAVGQACKTDIDRFGYRFDQSVSI